MWRDSAAAAADAVAAIAASRDLSIAVEALTISLSTLEKLLAVADGPARRDRAVDRAGRSLW